jgi:hypothetical protein
MHTVGETCIRMMEEYAGIDIVNTQFISCLQGWGVSRTLLEPHLRDPLLLACGQEVPGHPRGGEKDCRFDIGEILQRMITAVTIDVIKIGIDRIKIIAPGSQKSICLTAESFGVAGQSQNCQFIISGKEILHRQYLL